MGADHAIDLTLLSEEPGRRKPIADMSDHTPIHLHLADQVNQAGVGGHLGDQPHGTRRPTEQGAVAAAVEQAVQATATLDGVGPVRRRDLGADLQRPDEPAMSRTVSGDGLEQPAGHRSTSLP